MKNITLAVDEDVLERARIYADKRKTTVNRLVRDHLASLGEADRKAEDARERLLKLIDQSSGRLGHGWKRNREDAYEGRVLPRYQHPPVRRARKGR